MLLTRLSLDDMKRSPVDLTLLSREILHRSEEEGRLTPQHMTIDEDLVVSAEPRMMAITMDRMIDNAVKFSAKNPDPQGGGQRGRSS